MPRSEGSSGGCGVIPAACAAAIAEANSAGLMVAAFAGGAPAPAAAGRTPNFETRSVAAAALDAAAFGAASADGAAVRCAGSLPPLELLELLLLELLLLRERRRRRRRRRERSRLRSRLRRFDLSRSRLRLRRPRPLSLARPRSRSLPVSLFFWPVFPLPPVANADSMLSRKLVAAALALALPLVVGAAAVGAAALATAAKTTTVQ